MKPFLKWAGGKGQLLSEIRKYYPFDDRTITKYAEPFVGGGAVLLDILNRYDLEAIYISDINSKLIDTYLAIRDNIDDLIKTLYTIQTEFLPLNEKSRKAYYLTMREQFNMPGIDSLTTAALLIFLNKTCFNGLYRENKTGLFNVPFGDQKNPLICDEKNLRAVSQKLQNVTIVCGDYKASGNFIDRHTFVYIDPPYRPVTETANFTAYTKNSFEDKEQTELAEFIHNIHLKNAKILISNSDTADGFFEKLYPFCTIKKIKANRMINNNGKARGKTGELLISNF